MLFFYCANIRIINNKYIIVNKIFSLTCMFTFYNTLTYKYITFVEKTMMYIKPFSNVTLM